MEQKRVSFKVAKALKEAGYPQGITKDAYALRNWHVDIAVIKKFVKGKLYSNGWRKYFEMADAPTYTDVWFWLWRDAKWFIKIQPLKDKFHYQILDHHYDEWHSWGVLSMTGYLDPEEAMAAAIEYLVDNDLIKEYESFT